MSVETNWHGEEGGKVNPIFLIFLLVIVRLHTEKLLPRWPGSVSKVCVGGGGGWSTAKLVIPLAIAQPGQAEQ